MLGWAAWVCLPACLLPVRLMHGFVCAGDGEDEEQGEGEGVGRKRKATAPPSYDEPDDDAAYFE